MRERPTVRLHTAGQGIVRTGDEEEVAAEASTVVLCGVVHLVQV